MLYWLLYLILLAVLLAGVAINIVTLPGLWLMVGAAALYAIATHFLFLGKYTLMVLFGLALAGEIVEMFVGGAGAKKAGGGRRAIIGAVIGGIVGGIFLTFIPIPVVSTIVGVCLGSFLGAMFFELAAGEEISHSLRVGLGAAQGRFMGIVTKLAFGVVMLCIALWAALPIGAKAAASPATQPASSPAAQR